MKIKANWKVRSPKSVRQTRSGSEETVSIELAVESRNCRMMKACGEFRRALKFIKSWYNKKKFIRTITLKIIIEIVQKVSEGRSGSIILQSLFVFYK